MVNSRLKLQSKLEDILKSDEVYFQPPPDISMSYPAIVYSFNGYDKQYANDGSYKMYPIYTIIIIDENPDSSINEKIAKFPMCEWTTGYKRNNLNYFVYKLYFK